MYNLLFIVAVRFFSIAFGFECSQFDTNMGATFDLSDLVRYAVALNAVSL